MTETLKPIYEINEQETKNKSDTLESVGKIIKEINDNVSATKNDILKFAKNLGFEFPSEFNIDGNKGIKEIYSYLSSYKEKLHIEIASGNTSTDTPEGVEIVSGNTSTQTPEGVEIVSGNTSTQTPEGVEIV